MVKTRVTGEGEGEGLFCGESGVLTTEHFDPHGSSENTGDVPIATPEQVSAAGHGERPGVLVYTPRGTGWPHEEFSSPTRRQCRGGEV